MCYKIGSDVNWPSCTVIAEESSFNSCQNLGRCGHVGGKGGRLQVICSHFGTIL